MQVNVEHTQKQTMLMLTGIMNFFRTQLHLWIAVACLVFADTTFAVAEADLFIGYDQSYADTWGGDENVYVTTAAAVSYANGNADMSGTGVRLRICGYHKTTGQKEANNLAGFVSWLTNETDGNLDGLTDAANAAGADLLAYICQTTDAQYAAVTDSVGGRYTVFQPLFFGGKVIAHEAIGHAYGCEHRIGHGEPVTTIMLHNYCGKSDGYFSNPNIWYNGTNLLGNGGCLGSVVQGGDATWLISEAAQAKADYEERVVEAPSLDHVVHDWSFNQTAGSAPAGTTVTDSVTGTALATVLGNGAAFSGSGLQIPGGSKFDGVAYLQLPGGVISGSSEVTIEIWAKTLSFQYQEALLDFNNGSAEYMRLGLANSVNINYPSLVSAKGGTTVTAEGTLLPDVEGVLHHHAITYTSTGAGTGRWSWYRDGLKLYFIDVDYALTSFQDINNWLGKSSYSLADLANCEIQEVRISSVAMSQGQILSNYKLGVNYNSDATVHLTAADTSSNVGLCSFTSAGNWDSGSVPTNGYDYETFGFRIWAPRDGASHTFTGDSLRISSGKLLWNNYADSMLTINDLRLSGAEVVNNGLYEHKTLTLAGNLTLESESQIRAQEGEINLAADLSGSGNLLFLRNAVTLSGDNSAFTGKTLVGDGRFSTLRISDEAQLGSNPVSFTPDQLTLNRGILETTQNMTIDDSNRGIRIETDGGFLNASEGTTLTIDVPISSPAAGDTLQTAPMDSNPIEGILFFGGDGTVELTNPNNSHNAEMQVTAGAMKLTGNGRINNGDHWMPFLINGIFTDNSDLNQTLSGALSGNGAINMGGASTLTLSGASTFSGSMTVSNGTLMLNGSASSGSGTMTVAGGTLGGTGTVGGSLTVQSGTLSPGSSIGTLTVNGSATLQSSGTTYLEINAATDSSDLLDVSGSMTLGGTLHVVNLGGTLVYGDSFMLFDANSISGSFNSYDLPALDADLKWATNSMQTGYLIVDSTTPSAPPAPSGLQVFTLTDAQLRLEWGPAVSATSYTVERSDSSGGPYTAIATGISGTIFIDSGLTAGETYYYKVRAVNAIGESPDSSAAQGATVPTVGDEGAFAVAEWNFDQNLSWAGTALSDNPATDITGNGNAMHGYDYTYGTFYSALGDTPSGSGLSMDANGGQDGYTTSAAINSWTPQKWTIEASVVMDALGDWETFIGKNGSSHGVADSDFYLQKTDDVGDVRVSLATVSGQRVNINTGFFPTLGQWFHLVVTSDASTLSIYVNDGTGWSLKGSAALTGGSAANNALGNGGSGGTDWTFMRGWYGGGNVNQVDGRIDNIRFSQGARIPTTFLYDSLSMPGTPTGLVASAISADEIELGWSASTDAIGYYVKRSTSEGGPYAVVGETSDTGFNDTGLTAGTTYYYVVAAISTDTASDDSAEVGAVPPSNTIEPEEYHIADHAVEGGTNLLLTVSNSVLGHLYGILATDSLTPPAWTNILVEPGSGSNVQFNIPIDQDSTNRYFMIDVQSQ